MPSKNTRRYTWIAYVLEGLGIFAVCLFLIAVILMAIDEQRFLEPAAFGMGIALLLGFIVAPAQAIHQGLHYLKRLRQAKEDPRQQLRRRVDAVNNAFAEAATLMDELRRDLEAQQAARDQLLAEAEHQQRLLELNKEEAKKIRQILVNETKATIRAAWRREVGFFLAGVLVSAALSVPIGIWVNSIS
ncbi:hypothetical protein [Nonomuraea polychroma]|uniref:hypothetical protein n=1 Tax=Nonomuraea polychroma TaxID=46176 RepID=UPI000FDEFC9F|nr:hypothetical protein [Nonomuraea polychroma]